MAVATVLGVSGTVLNQGTTDPGSTPDANNVLQYGTTS